ncbi:MAG TPA: hypothetical protein VFE63_07835 [Roseiarcus sp.]|nr:hypothetical protein [Roseiarcus sp.]
MTQPNQTDHSRAKRIIAALIEGADLDAVAAQERLPAEEVQAILHEELSQRWVAPVADFAKIQIARLENLCLHVMDRVDSGELGAIDRAVKIVDRLDRYHGFHRASPAIERYEDDERQKLLDKLNAVAARLHDEPPDSGSDQ